MIAVPRSYKIIFNEEKIFQKCIKALVIRFRETGSTADRQHSGRPRTVASCQFVSTSVVKSAHVFDEDTLHSTVNASHADHEL